MAFISFRGLAVINFNDNDHDVWQYQTFACPLKNSFNFVINISVRPKNLLFVRSTLRYVIVDEFVDVSGTGWARTYFIVNYIMGVAVILNLVITVVINSFWDEYKNSNMPALALRQLHDAAAASARHDATFPVSGSRDGVDNCTGGYVSPSSQSGLRENGWGWPFGDGRDGGEVRITEEESDRRDTEAPDSVARSSSQNSSNQLVHTHFPPHAMPEGDQGGMEAERAVARRASRRRLDISGIT